MFDFLIFDFLIFLLLPKNRLFFLRSQNATANKLNDRKTGFVILQ